MDSFENTDLYIWIGFFAFIGLILWLHKMVRKAETEFQREVMQDER